MAQTTDVYFANLTGQSFLEECLRRVEGYRNFCETSGLSTKWATSVGAYYGYSLDGKESWAVSRGGEFGEMVQAKVNDYASLLRHQLVLAIADRPAGIAKAVNMDSDTLRNARIGSQLVEYYLSDPSRMFENDYVQALELALMSSEGFVVQDWDTAIGDDVRPDLNGNIIKNGDIRQYVFAIWNAARDVGAPDPGSHQWYIFSRKENKYDLAAKYPNSADAILSTGKNLSRLGWTGALGAPQDGTDYIEVHWLVHPPSAACKAGRYARFIEGEMLIDAQYPYRKPCYHRCSDRDMFETAFGHTSNYDLLSLEQVTDTFWSIAINALSTFGVATIVGPKGGGVTHQELAAGMRYLEVDPAHVDKIRALDLAKLPDALLPLIQATGIKKGEMSGINSILRGNPEGALRGSSGAAMALLQSQAIKFNSGVQRAFYRILSSGGTGIIEFLEQFGATERIAKIAGKVNQQAIKEFRFTGDQMRSVSTVVFEPVNPVLQTSSGKLTVADTLMEKGALTNPEDYIEVLTTGNLSVVTNPMTAMKEAILQENEELMEGREVLAVITENHQKHIAAHQTVIYQPNAKKDPRIVQLVTDHINEHLRLWQQASEQNPALLVATGQEVLPPPPGMSGGPGGAAPPAVKPGGGPIPMDARDSSVIQAEAVRQPNLPNPPTDPSTGEPAPVAAGTSVQ